MGLRGLLFQEAGKVRAIVMGKSFFSDYDKGVKGESAQDKVPSWGHVQSITRSTRLRAVGPLRGSTLGAGIGVTTEKDLGWERGRCIVEGQLINAGSPQEDRDRRVRNWSGARPGGRGEAGEAEWISLKLLEAFKVGDGIT